MSVCSSIRPSQNFKIKRQSLPTGTVGWSSGSLMTPVLFFFCSYLLICICLAVLNLVKTEVKIRQDKKWVFPFNPPGHCGIGGHHFHTWCPYVHHKNRNALQRSENKMLATKNTMRENNDHLLAGAWWVTLKSPDLFFHFLRFIRPLRSHFPIKSKSL